MQLDLENTSPPLRLTLEVDGQMADMFAIFEKTAYTWTGTLRDDAGAAVNITGWALRLKLFPKRTGAALKEWTTGGGGLTLTVPASGKFTITVAATDVAVSEDVVHGIYELVAYSAGSLAGAVTGRVQGPAEVIEVEHEP